MDEKGLFEGLLAFAWWRHDKDKAERKAEQAERAIEQEREAHSDAPKKWNAVVKEWE